MILNIANLSVADIKLPHCSLLLDWVAVRKILGENYYRRFFENSKFIRPAFLEWVERTILFLTIDGNLLRKVHLNKLG